MLLVKIPLFISYLIRKIAIGMTVKHSSGKNLLIKDI